MLEVHDPRILRELTRPGPMGVVIDRASDEGNALQRFVAAFPGATLTRDEAAWVSYKLPATRGAPPPDVSGTPLAVKALDAVPSAPHATRALDGDLRTRWSGGPQRAIAEFTVELAQSSHVSQVVPCLGEFMGDYPRQLRVDVSADGSHWDTAFVGDTVLLAYYGAVRHPREIPIVVPIDRDNVRFIRLQQSGVGDHDWSIAEISVRN